MQDCCLKGCPDVDDQRLHKCPRVWRCTSSSDDGSLQKTQLKSLGELHLISESRATKYRCLQERRHNCCVSATNPFLIHGQLWKFLIWANKELCCCSVVQSPPKWCWWWQVHCVFSNPNSVQHLQTVFELLMLPPADELYGDADFLFHQ